ncbi:hypothetical protein [Methanobacterium alcaliphilum]|uniref:hypothetical protein n=1 Tax=Methanobacterium alcaliphilum TaxID=392018 RepID=UPI00200A506F|nr:hypothetical protein [Methanobacterium alcaliphilum]MCK9151808.1 hypothetical protein [Methanobacterium alcaliphilum]
MKPFKVFNENMKKKFLCAPLNHPNIDYKWIEKDIQLENEIYKIDFVGDIVDNINIDIIEMGNYKVGFFDKNQNFITPILFHPLNLKKSEYKELLKKIKDLSDLNLVFKDKIEISSKNKALIDEMETNQNFLLDIFKYLASDKFDFSNYDFITTEDLENLITLIKNNKDTICKEYPHLQFIVNLLD